MQLQVFGHEFRLRPDVIIEEEADSSVSHRGPAIPGYLLARVRLLQDPKVEWGVETPQDLEGSIRGPVDDHKDLEVLDGASLE